MEHLQSTQCKLLRCALEVIDRIKPADVVRITTVPIVFAAAASVDNNITSKSTTSTTNPHAFENELQDRVQRRKEKKRRKIELRKQQQEESAIKSEVVTFCNFGSSSTNTSSVSSPTSSDSTPIPQSVRAIITVKPLIILDVNGILCHRLRQKSQVLPLSPAPHSRTKRVITFRPSVGHVANTDIVPRSDLHQFLTMLNNNFSLAVCKYLCMILCWQ
jgi:hypothetical protein